MDRKKRVSLIKKIERNLQSPLLVYFLGDRPLAATQIADDSIRPMYDHLRKIGKQKRITLFLYGLGGFTETPWKIVTMLREFCEELWVTVPYKSYSAATMVCLGADRILMGSKGELGPIDPALQFVGPERPEQLLLPEIGVEDVASYVNFLRNRVGLNDQSALVAPIGTLAQVLTPPLLGRIERIYSHIRLVARKLLLVHQQSLDETKVKGIIEALTEKSYAHGHGIGRKEAKEIGLPVDFLGDDVEPLIWNLYEGYEKYLNLRSNPDPFSYFADTGPDTYVENQRIFACIESAKMLDAYTGDFRLQKVRKMPPQLNINLNLNLQLPPNVQPAQIPQQAQQILQQLVQQLTQQVQQIVTEQVNSQAPVERIDARILGGHWVRS